MTNPAKTVVLPPSSLVVLIGLAGSGKSTFAHARFRPSEILSSDHFRALVCDDEGDQTATADAFLLLRLVLEKRLERGRLSIVDATNLEAKYRAPLLALARRFKRAAIALLFCTSEDACIARAAGRLERIVDESVIRKQSAAFRVLTDEDLLAEGFRKVVRLDPADGVQIRRATPRKPSEK